MPNDDERVRNGRFFYQTGELKSNVLGGGRERRELRVAIAGTVVRVAAQRGRSSRMTAAQTRLLVATPETNRTTGPVELLGSGPWV